LQKRTFAVEILSHQNRYALPQWADNRRAGRSVPILLGITG